MIYEHPKLYAVGYAICAPNLADIVPIDDEDVPSHTPP